MDKRALHIMLHDCCDACALHQIISNIWRLSRAMQGLCRMTATHFKDALCCVRLWIHECERVYGDRLVSEADLAKFADLRMRTTMKFFGNLDQVL